LDGREYETKKYEAKPAPNYKM